MSCTGCSFNNSATTRSDVYDWINDLPDTAGQSNIVEVKFKSTRREFFKNTDNLPLKRGDKIVVATSPGHDLGEVTLIGYLAEKQFKRKIKYAERFQWNNIFRKATDNDLQNLGAARDREKTTMIRARQIAKELGLDMKVGDVEFRGDGKKAIFYYIADGRVDFRELIKRYATEFQIRVEMKQIGARQEAGLVGGIGSCGRELCCSSWRTDFSSITSEAAIKQGLSPSAQKMAGACGKLKCCLLYELDVYIEAEKEFPKELLDLETSKGVAKPIKTDYLKKEIWYIIDSNVPGNTFNLSIKEVKDIIQKNKRGIKPEIQIQTDAISTEAKLEVSLDERIDRFDHGKNVNNKPGRKKNRNNRNKKRYK